MALATETPRHRFFPPAQEIDISQLLCDAQFRWLKPIEVCEILHNHHKFRLSPDPAHKPPSGSLFLFDRKALRYFRKDGHNWRKKKDGKTVREAHERLKAGSIDVLHCYYAHGEENPNFQRRSYWLLEEPLEHIVLVHYREVTEGNRVGIGKTSFGISRADGNLMHDSTQGITQHLASSPSEGLSSSFNQDNDETESGEELDNCSTQELQQCAGQQIPLLQQLTKDIDLDMIGTSLRQGQVELQSANSSSFAASRGTNSLPVYSSNSSLNQYEPSKKLESAQKSKTNYFHGDLEDLENMDFNELLQSSDTGKLSTADTLDSSTWKALLEGASDMADGKFSDWKDLLDQVTPSTTDASGLTGPDSGYNEATNDRGAGRSASPPLHQGFLEGFSSRGLGREPETVLEAHLRAATVQTAVNKAALEEQERIRHLTVDSIQDKRYEAVADQQNWRQKEPFCWGSVLEQPKKIDQVQPGLLDEKNTNIMDSQHWLQPTELEQDKRQWQEQQSFKKQDSFGSWFMKELGEDQNSLLVARSSSQSFWQLPIEDQAPSVDDSRLSQEMQLHSGLSPSLSQKQLFSILDFSPEWAYCSEGTKVIVTGIFMDTTKDQSDYEWCCMFGEIEVPAEVLQLGVLRCNAPPHAPGRVAFYVTCNDRVACSEVKEFEYCTSPSSPIGGPVTGRISACDDEENEQQLEEMLLQIRFAHVLSTIETVPFSSVDLSSRVSTVIVNEENWIQTEGLARAKRWPYEDAKKMLLQNLLKRELHQWLLCKTGEGKGVMFFDEHGQGILHMAAALGYEWAIAPILAAGVGVNFRDSHGWTALHWAAHCGREKVVVGLVAADAAAGALTDPTPKYPTGRTAADLAACRGHGGIAGYLAEASLTSHLSSLNLGESEVDRISAAVAGDKAVETVSERSIVSPIAGVTEDQLSLKDTLAAVRNAAQAAARIQSAFRAHSFRIRQQLMQPEVDEFGMLQEEVCTFAATQTSHRASRGHRERMNLAATQIQCKFRGWKGRKEFLSLRQRIVKIQAHVRGHQVRKKYKKLLWTVGILDKAILRWRRKGQGLRGFRSEGTENNVQEEESDDDDLFKDFRRQKEEGFEEELLRVQVMVQSPEARHQYRRMLENFQKAKGIQNIGDPPFDDEFMSLLD